ncbi:acyltransferase [Brachybacterium sp. FME24]|uniref:acyltransferase family protein n=1 Tax=Brachybacterium sp. FME24 TaxID=2742605 RepID=UPI001867D05D|nr:acyltransferase [Brachybacterium sp. FME24]
MISSETVAPSGRQHWMDLLRGTAIMLVIGHHLRLVQQIWDGSTPHEMVVLSEATAPFRMPVLLFASGLLLARSLEKPTARYLSGKARSLLWPWLIWSAVMLPIMGWAFGADPLWWLNGIYTWFLVALFLYYVVGLVTRYIPPGWLALASIAGWTALPLLGVELDVSGNRPDKFLYYAVFFFAGAALRRVLAARTVPIAILVPALLVAAAWAGYAARIDLEPAIPVISQLAVLLGVIAAIGVAQRLPRVRPVRALEWIGRNSIVPYLVHLPVIEILGRHIDLAAGRATFALYFLVTLGICVLAVLARPATGFLYALPGRALSRARDQATDPKGDSEAETLVPGADLEPAAAQGVEPVLRG